MKTNHSSDQLLDSTTQSIRFTVADLFLRIWFQPLSVFRYIQTQRFEQGMLLISALAGMYLSLGILSLTSIPSYINQETTVVPGLMLSMILGGLAGVICPFILASSLAYFGAWLGGKAGGRNLLRIIIYAMIPILFALFIVLIRIAILKDGYFHPASADDFSSGVECFLWIAELIEYCCCFWSLILLILSIAYVQEFNYLSALLNLLLLSIGPILLFHMVSRSLSSSSFKEQPSNQRH